MEFAKFIAFVLGGTVIGTGVLGGAVKLLMVARTRHADAVPTARHLA
jgi:hypothetical protein